jgi:hypothetical protein
VVEPLPSKCRTLSSIPSTGKKKKRKKERKERRQEAGGRKEGRQSLGKVLEETLIWDSCADLPTGFSQPQFRSSSYASSNCSTAHHHS